jgi:hypothetical protein
MFFEVEDVAKSLKAGVSRFLPNDCFLENEC